MRLRTRKPPRLNQRLNPNAGTRFPARPAAKRRWRPAKMRTTKGEAISSGSLKRALPERSMIKASKPPGPPQKKVYDHTCQRRCVPESADGNFGHARLCCAQRGQGCSQSHSAPVARRSFYKGLNPHQLQRLANSAMRDGGGARARVRLAALSHRRAGLLVRLEFAEIAYRVNTPYHPHELFVTLF